MRKVSRGAARRLRGGAQLWTGERREREGTPPSQVSVSHLLPDSAASHRQRWIATKRQRKGGKKGKTYCTAPSNSTSLWFWCQLFGVKSNCVERTNYKRQVLPCITVCAGEQLRYQNQVKWSMKYEWACVYKPVNTVMQRVGGGIIVLAFTKIKCVF